MKYNSRKTEVNGIRFDSRLEADRYIQLLNMEKAGQISQLKLQPEFQISKGWTDPRTGEKIRSRFYKADFMYCDDRETRIIVEDVKGMETAEFKLKWDLVRSEYPEFDFRKVRKEDM